MVDPDANAVKHTMNLPASMSVQILLNEVAKQFGYLMGTISVHYERQINSNVEEVQFLLYFMDESLSILNENVDLLYYHLFIDFEIMIQCYMSGSKGCFRT